jgi:hypothetical protein
MARCEANYFASLASSLGSRRRQTRLTIFCEANPKKSNYAQKCQRHFWHPKNPTGFL